MPPKQSQAEAAEPTLETSNDGYFAFVLDCVHKSSVDLNSVIEAVRTQQEERVVVLTRQDCLEWAKGKKLLIADELDKLGTETETGKLFAKLYRHRIHEILVTENERHRKSLAENASEEAAERNPIRILFKGFPYTLADIAHLRAENVRLDACFAVNKGLVPPPQKQESEKRKRTRPGSRSKSTKDSSNSKGKDAKGNAAKSAKKQGVQYDEVDDAQYQQLPSLFQTVSEQIDQLAKDNQTSYLREIVLLEMKMLEFEYPQELSADEQAAMAEEYTEEAAALRSKCIADILSAAASTALRKSDYSEWRAYNQFQEIAEAEELGPASDYYKRLLMDIPEERITVPVLVFAMIEQAVRYDTAGQSFQPEESLNETGDDPLKDQEADIVSLLDTAFKRLQQPQAFSHKPKSTAVNQSAIIRLAHGDKAAQRELNPCFMKIDDASVFPGIWDPNLGVSLRDIELHMLAMIHIFPTLSDTVNPTEGQQSDNSVLTSDKESFEPSIPPVLSHQERGARWSEIMFFISDQQLRDDSPAAQRLRSFNRSQIEYEVVLLAFEDLMKRLQKQIADIHLGSDSGSGPIEWSFGNREYTEPITKEALIQILTDHLVTHKPYVITEYNDLCDAVLAIFYVDTPAQSFSKHSFSKKFSVAPSFGEWLSIVEDEPIEALTERDASSLRYFIEGKAGLLDEETVTYFPTDGSIISTAVLSHIEKYATCSVKKDGLIFGFRACIKNDESQPSSGFFTATMRDGTVCVVCREDAHRGKSTSERNNDLLSQEPEAAPSQAIIEQSQTNDTVPEIEAPTYQTVFYCGFPNGLHVRQTEDGVLYQSSCVNQMHRNVTYGKSAHLSGKDMKVIPASVPSMLVMSMTLDESLEVWNNATQTTTTVFTAETHRTIHHDLCYIIRHFKNGCQQILYSDGSVSTSAPADMSVDSASISSTNVSPTHQTDSPTSPGNDSRPATARGSPKQASKATPVPQKSTTSITPTKAVKSGKDSKATVVEQEEPVVEDRSDNQSEAKKRVVYWLRTNSIGRRSVSQHAYEVSQFDELGNFKNAHTEPVSCSLETINGATNVDPETNSKVFTREDLVMKLEYPDGTQLVQHADGTRFWIFPRVTDSGMVERKSVLIEMPGFASTLIDYAEEITITTEMPGGGVIRFDAQKKLWTYSQNEDEFMIRTETNQVEVRLSSIQTLMKETLPKREVVEEPETDVYRGVFVFDYKSGGLQYTDIDYTRFNIAANGKGHIHYYDPLHPVSDDANNEPENVAEASTNNESTEKLLDASLSNRDSEQAAEGEIHNAEAEQDQMVSEQKISNKGLEVVVTPTNRLKATSSPIHHPRLFIIHKDGSGAELLTPADVKEYIRKAQEGELLGKTSIMQEPTNVGNDQISTLTFMSRYTTQPQNRQLSCTKPIPRCVLPAHSRKGRNNKAKKTDLDFSKCFHYRKLSRNVRLSEEERNELGIRLKEWKRWHMKRDQYTASLEYADTRTDEEKRAEEMVNQRIQAALALGSQQLEEGTEESIIAEQDAVSDTASAGEHDINDQDVELEMHLDDSLGADGVERTDKDSSSQRPLSINAVGRPLYWNDDPTGREVFHALQNEVYRVAPRPPPPKSTSMVAPLSTESSSAGVQSFGERMRFQRLQSGMNSSDLRESVYADMEAHARLTESQLQDIHNQGSSTNGKIFAVPNHINFGALDCKATSRVSLQVVNANTSPVRIKVTVGPPEKGSRSHAPLQSASSETSLSAEASNGVEKGGEALWKAIKPVYKKGPIAPGISLKVDLEFNMADISTTTELDPAHNLEPIAVVHIAAQTGDHTAVPVFANVLADVDIKDSLPRRVVKVPPIQHTPKA